MDLGTQLSTLYTFFSGIAIAIFAVGLGLVAFWFFGSEKKYEKAVVGIATACIALIVILLLPSVFHGVKDFFVNHQAWTPDTRTHTDLIIDQPSNFGNWDIDVN